jgi:curved DNA-binding protein CbpA
MDDHYEALGLEPDATPEQIKKAFKALALQYHPDQHPSPIAAAIFRRIHEAYKVLSDPEQRRRYDEQRLRGRRAPPPRPASPPVPKDEIRRREAVYRERYARRMSRQARVASEKAQRENEERLGRILEEDDD